MTEPCEICEGKRVTTWCPSCGGQGDVGLGGCFERTCDECKGTGRVKEHACQACSDDGKRSRTFRD